MKNKKHKIKIPKGYKFYRSFEIAASNDEKAYMTVFKPIKKELPKTWDEFFRTDGSNMYGWNVWLSDKYQHAFVALNKLLQLRDHYNDGWEPDWSNSHIKCVIYIDHEYISKASVKSEFHILAFEIEKVRDEFLSNFRELIETAKPLL